MVCDHRPPSTIALFLDQLAAVEEEQSAWRRVMVSAFPLAPAVATDILLKEATSMNEYTALNGRKGASLLTEGVKIVPFQQSYLLGNVQHRK